MVRLELISTERQQLEYYAQILHYNQSMYRVTESNSQLGTYTTSWTNEILKKQKNNKLAGGNERVILESQMANVSTSAAGQSQQEERSVTSCSAR